jgi:hypothetical protein
MKKVVSIVCLLLSAFILTSSTAFAYPRDREYTQEKTTVVVPSVQARFGAVGIKINSLASRNFVWVTGHWQWMGRFRGYAWIPAHWEKRVQYSRGYGYRPQHYER